MKVFITGGTTGIGLELAKIYLKEGHTVGICGRDIKKIDSHLFSEFKNLNFFQVDVCDREELIKIVDEFSEGKLDLMIANAGVSSKSKSKPIDFESSYKVLDINIRGFYHTIEASLKNMITHKSGHIVAISSVAGFIGLPDSSAYSSSKAAVRIMMESLSMDLVPFNINTTCICPGYIDTPLTKKNRFPMPFIMSAKKGAIIIKKAIDKKTKLKIFPFRMGLIIFILRILPRGIYRKLMLFTNRFNGGRG